MARLSLKRSHVNMMHSHLELVLSVCLVTAALPLPNAEACSYRLGPNIAVTPPADPSDTTPPDRADVSEVVVVLRTDPVDTGGLTCPDVDSMTFEVRGHDDRTADGDLRLVAWMGRTPEEARDAQESAITFGFSDVSTRSVLVGLGKSVGRERDGEPFRSPSPFCFAVALMDAAGNVGLRSEPQCVATRDERHALIKLEPGQACRCAVVGQPPTRSFGWLGAGLVLLLRVRRRSRRGESG